MKKIILYFSISFLIISCQTGKKQKKLSENHHQIAISLMKECDHRRALSHLLKGVKIDPRNFLIRYTLAVVHFTLKDYELALQQLRRVLKQNPKVTEARMTMARSYLELGKAGHALKEIKLAEQDKTYTNPLKIISLKGLTYFKNGELLKAKKQFQEILSIPSAGDCFTTLHLGQIEMKLKNPKKAEKILKQARLICSNEKSVCGKKNYDSHFFLASLYLQKNLKRKARYHFRVFLKTAKTNNPHVSKAKKLLKKAL